MTSLTESIQAKAKAANTASAQSRQVTGMASTASDIVTAPAASPNLADDAEYLVGIAEQYQNEAYLLVHIRHVIGPKGELIKPDNYGAIEATSKFLQGELAHLAKTGAVIKLPTK